MNGLQTVIDMEEIHTNFRLWLTTEVNKDFPIGLLQMSLKFTNEPPQGIRASLKRTYADVTQDTLDYSNHPSWPSLLYSVAFLHTVVQVSLNFFCKHGHWTMNISNAFDDHFPLSDCRRDESLEPWDGTCHMNSTWRTSTPQLSLS